MSGIIEVENLSFCYTSKSTILKDMSFEVKPGAFLAIAGPNGAGKSTLLNLMCGTLKPKSGTIKIDAAPIGSYNNQTLAAKVAVVRQEFVPVFGFSVIEMVLMARTPYYGPMGFESQTDRQIADNALEATDTAQFATRPLASLSSGERQRVFIARAFAQDSPILLLDEPTNFLDLKHQVGIYDLLKAAQLEKGKTIIAVTHDINQAIQYCDEILLLGADSNYHIGKTKDVFFPEQIKKVFGVQVFAGEVGREKFFIPLGKLAKDSGQISN
ncbi:MAG: ABC transporter ATP-binding protein [Planctomycetota bacterium]|jgi:iron complex transport system ATP-binding protein